MKEKKQIDSAKSQEMGGKGIGNAIVCFLPEKKDSFVFAKHGLLLDSFVSM